MTTLYQHLNELKTQALKDKDSFTFTKLGTVLGEAKQIATKKENRDPTDDEVIEIVKKGLDGIAETLTVEKDDFKRATLLIERDLLMKFMPTQLSDVEIVAIIENAALDNVGKIMGLFKNMYKGKYDGAVVKRAADAYLAGR